MPRTGSRREWLDSHQPRYWHSVASDLNVLACLHPCQQARKVRLGLADVDEHDRIVACLAKHDQGKVAELIAGVNADKALL